MSKAEEIQKNKGVLPPQAISMEEAVLGAIINFPASIDEMMMIIKTPDAFYKEEHKCIFIAIKKLFDEGSPVDMITVSQKLKSLGMLEKAGGDFKIVMLTQLVASAAHIEYHSRIIMQKYIAREIIKFCSGVVQLAYDDATDVFELMGKLQTQFDAVSNVTIEGHKTRDFEGNLIELRNRVEFLSHAKETNTIVGVRTGFKRVDDFTGGYKEGDLVVLAARPGMGKTSLVLKTAIENIKNNVPVAFISLEMSAMQLTARLVSIDTDFHLKQLIKTGFEHQKYFDSFNVHYHRMKDYSLFIDDTPETDINSIVLKARYLKRVHGIKLLIVDYLQLMTVKDPVSGKHLNNREQEISTISRRLKLLAKELEIPVIALSQLSRAVETRGGLKRPQLSDLRESGAIEQDADIIQFIYRPAYYGIEIEGVPEFEHLTDDGADTELIFAKYRGGSLATTGLKWIGDKTKFIDPIHENYQLVNAVGVVNDSDVIQNAQPKYGDNPF